VGRILADFPRAPERAAGLGAGVLAVGEDRDVVDEDVLASSGDDSLTNDHFDIVSRRVPNRPDNADSPIAPKSSNELSFGGRPSLRFSLTSGKWWAVKDSNLGPAD
jgi:hypothetical protein